MDIHNIDEYLDLQGQNQMNLLSTEEITTQPEEEESEWHSATAAPTTNDTATPSLSEMLEAAAAASSTNGANPYLFNVEHTGNGDNSHHQTEWGLLQNDLDLQGINLTQITGNGGILVNDNNQTSSNFITPDSLLKQPVAAVVGPDELEEKRVTRSLRATASPITPTKKESAAAKKNTSNKKKASTSPRAKKLYCICQQPYNGKPMVQCDRCEEWFHCACVEFDQDEQDEDDIDWVCKGCLEAKDEPAPKQEPVKQEEKSAIEPAKAPIPTPAVITSTRQTRGSSRNQSKCLYPGCSNRTRADSYCSDVCARRHKEADNKKDATEEEEQSGQPATRLSRMKGATAISVNTKPSATTKTRATDLQRKTSLPTMAKKEAVEDDDDHVEEEAEEDDASEAGVEEEEDEEDQEEEGTESPNTPSTPMSPSQMTEQENPVRRNVIKNISNILKQIIDTALEDNPDLFDEEQDKMDPPERAEKLAKSIENTMLEQLGDVGKAQKNRRTCGEPYKSKFRSLLYNLKDKQNQVFQLRVITGDLSPLELVKMSSEDMANPEIKSKAEIFRKIGLKNVVMKLDNTPIIKKTHKGDIIMIPNKDNNTNQNMYSEQVESNGIGRYNTPTLSGSNEEKAETKEVEEKEEKPKITSFSPTTTSDGSKADPLDDILARIGIPSATHDDSNSNKRSASDSNNADYTKKRKVTLDVEELLGEEDDTPFQVDEVDTSELVQQEDSQMDEEESKKEEKQEDKLPTIWQGRVNMPQVAEFDASARQIGGRLLSETEWQEVLSPTMWIEGRIPPERVTSYVTQNQYSTSREIVLLEIEPDSGTTTNETQSQTLLKYLHSRQRYAVVGHNKTKVKDFYLIPLYKVQHIPDCLYVVRVEETKRECDLFLGVLVLSKSQPVVSPTVAHHKPVVVATAPAPAPVPATPHHGTHSSSPAVVPQQHHQQYQHQSYAIPQAQQSYSTYNQHQHHQEQQQPQYGYGYQAQQHHHHQQSPSYGRRPSQQQNQQHRYSNYNNNQRNNNAPYGGSSHRPSF